MVRAVAHLTWWYSVFESGNGQCYLGTASLLHSISSAPSPQHPCFIGLGILVDTSKAIVSTYEPPVPDIVQYFRGPVDIVSLHNIL